MKFFLLKSSHVFAKMALGLVNIKHIFLIYLQFISIHRLYLFQSFQTQNTLSLSFFLSFFLSFSLSLFLSLFLFISLFLLTLSLRPTQSISKKFFISNIETKLFLIPSYLPTFFASNCIC